MIYKNQDALVKNARNNELAIIHLAIKNLGWTDADYRSILCGRTGKNSAKDLTPNERKNFIAYLRSNGYQPIKKPFNQADKIAWLWRKLEKAGALRDSSNAALMAFVGRTTGIEVAHLRFLPVAKATQVINGLQAWLNRP